MDFLIKLAVVLAVIWGVFQVLPYAFLLVMVS
jgi:hypothetical protein